MKKNNFEKLAVLVPAHNEEKVIAATLESLLKIVSKKDIYLVDDGSVDNTVQIAKKYIDNILVQRNQGKATAMNAGITHFNLIKQYEYILPMDADTRITEGFIKASLAAFRKDKKKEISGVVGKVVGKSKNWITSYRLWEYEIAQTIHKPAQSHENAIVVCAGCATVYRSSLFEITMIPQGTMTEDMDFTFLIHRKNLGRIVFVNDAVVITQDPQSLRDFVKQVDRWYTGFWQCLTKHNIPWGGQMLDFEVGLLATEGLFNGILLLVLFLLLPLTVSNTPEILFIPFAFDFLFFLLPTMYLTAKRHKLWRIFLYLPHFYFMRIVSTMVFFNSFLKIIFGIDLSMNWNKAARYSVH